ncbi:hypothetical protein KBZ10_22515 [Streptomyces sp. F63]|uniref:hypothetical protein n=1 Tax=Streptomyces sp. F63 TaxID=2824887 RepID=UPI001B37CAF6|nr:hypothetical protein [Streptomyces sp. F63]MBQ0987241.1 hypothetical protein [Streptomyces sp. F63]
MYGPVPVPPQPRPPDGGNVIALRVLFVAVTLLLFGMLAWVAMLRIAILRRRALDWALFWGVLLLTITWFVIVDVYPETDWRTDVATLGLLVMTVAVVAHYLVADIQYHRRPVAVAGPGGLPGPGPYGPPGTGAQTYPAAGMPTRPGGIPQQQQQQPPQQQPPQHAPGMSGYGFPQPPAASGPTAARPAVPGPAGAVTPPQSPPAGSPGVRPQPQRIQRVRAELDELSDLLRREEGDATGDGSGPR